ADPTTLRSLARLDDLLGQQPEPPLTAARPRTVQHVDDVVRARVLVDETDQVRPPPREAACRETRVIVELLDDLEHSRACLFAHVRFIVENSRDCLDGYACRLR